MEQIVLSLHNDLLKRQIEKYAKKGDLAFLAWLGIIFRILLK